MRIFIFKFEKAFKVKAIKTTFKPQSMKILKFTLLLLLPFAFSSCNNDDEMSSTSSTQLKSTKNGESLLGDSPARLYNEVVEANDQYATYSSLDSGQKAQVWQGKYDDFIANSELTTSELEFVNGIKAKFTESFFENIEENYNTDEIKLLELKAKEIFGNSRGLSLFYSMETVYKSTAQKNCFWCNNIVVEGSEGPCHIEYFNGVPQYVQSVDVVKVRFWITVQTYTTLQSCTP